MHGAQKVHYTLTKTEVTQLGRLEKKESNIVMPRVLQIEKGYRFIILFSYFMFFINQLATIFQNDAKFINRV